ncbi:uncharacterized protein B0H18DRAFT_1119828 [Fomitopsis serialis]|uniref:uncharacterized protein n=1 Tax=Fomitopsis serialis TaxID=139415 RepID=UPI0020085BDC|nr:uncharacterized protein B0H18DRAFT_1119828 [Neoantrodia serialis]KAH9924818.1 hypothetical protein B0H18DRAFT_1119828 [Neoantrodia serialis]
MLYAGPGTHLISSMPIIVVPVLVPRFLSIYHCRATTRRSLKSFTLAGIADCLGPAISAFMYAPFDEETMAFIQRTIEKDLAAHLNLTAGAGASRAVGKAPSFWEIYRTKAPNNVAPACLHDPMFAITVTNEALNAFLESGDHRSPVSTPSSTFPIHRVSIALISTAEDDVLRQVAFEGALPQATNDSSFHPIIYRQETLRTLILVNRAAILHREAVIGRISSKIGDAGSKHKFPSIVDRPILRAQERVRTAVPVEHSMVRKWAYVFDEKLRVLEEYGHQGVHIAVQAT